ncbi:hypothetical protein [Leptospira sp. 'Mane']|uniref:hypothetical protein n=1 Tax=Leptospira sp. 'Mane' TaxID=3387407 RepID=UPI00398A7EE5
MKFLQPIVIDTNILYYWSETEISDLHNPILIEEELQGKQIYVSELSFYEFVVKYKDYPDRYIKICDFLANRQIGILPAKPGIINHFIRNFESYLKNESFQDLYTGILSNRIEIESELLSFLVESVAVELSLAINKISKNKLNSAKFEHYIIALISSNQNHLKSELRKHLEEFYSSVAEEKSKVLKRNIHELLDAILLASAINHNIVENDIDILNSKNIEHLMNNISNNLIRKDIVNHTLSKDSAVARKPFFVKYENEISQLLLDFEIEMTKSMGRGLVKYYSYLIKKIFTTPRQIEKNDIIDSVFLNAYPSFQLITADKRFRKIIKELDSEYHLINEEFLDRIKSKK